MNGLENRLSAIHVGPQKGIGIVYGFQIIGFIFLSGIFLSVSQ